MSVALQPAAIVMSGKKDPMVISPTEIERAGKLSSDKCFLGRVVNVEDTTDRFTCYLVCGNNPKELLAVEAWSVMAPIAKNKFVAGSVVRVHEVALTQVKTSKKKYSHSLSNYFIRFDKDAVVELKDDKKDLPTDVPTVTLAVAKCMRQGLVDLVGFVSSSTHKPPEGKRTDTLQCLTLLQPGKKDNTASVELTAWREHQAQAADLKTDNVYIFRNLAVQYDKNNTFGLNWVPKTMVSLDTSNAAKTFFQKVKDEKSPVVNLSTYKGNAAKNYETIVPKATSLALVASLMENATKNFQEQDVWEFPCVAITSIEARAKSEECPFSYDGCSECYKKSCTSHSAAVTRPCYAWELSCYDHSASTTMKIFTKHVDEVLRGSLSLQTGHRVANFAEAIKEIRAKRWSVKVVFSFEEAYKSHDYTRDAHNTLVVVGIKPLDMQWRGLSRPILSCLTDSVGPGVPLAMSEDLKVDEAGQVFLDNQMVTSVEMLVRITEDDPKQEDNEEEKGVRICFQADDLLSGSPKQVRLVWLVPVSESLRIGRLRPGTCFLAHVMPRLNLSGVDPCIDSFQVLHASDFDANKASNLQARREWQQSTDMTQASKRKDEYCNQSPPSRLKSARKEHASPGYNGATSS